MKLTKLFLFALIAVLFCSCSSNNASIEGKFAGIKNKKIIMEEMTSNAVFFLDSTRTNDNGEFDFKYNFENSNPVFLRIRHENDFIILIAKPKDKIEINSMLNLSSNYIVNGSEDSERIRTLNNTLTQNYEEIYRLTNDYNNASDKESRDKISYAIANRYISQKQESIRFLIKNSKSLASLVALYQIMPNGVSIFGEDKDLQYFKLVSDSLTSIYPDNKYVLSLNNTIKNFENSQNINDIISDAVINDNTVSYPEISLPDKNGKIINLSDLQGKVIMLVFWNPYQKSSVLLNTELKEVYSAYSEKGLEIYQVSLDSNLPAFIQRTNTQQIPWVSVCDIKAQNSVLIRTYNIQAIPENYIINRNGDIVGKSLWGNNLINKLNTLF